MSWVIVSSLDVCIWRCMVSLFCLSDFQFRFEYFLMLSSVWPALGFCYYSSEGFYVNFYGVDNVCVSEVQVQHQVTLFPHKTAEKKEVKMVSLFQYLLEEYFWGYQVRFLGGFSVGLKSLLIWQLWLQIIVVHCDWKHTYCIWTQLARSWAPNTLNQFNWFFSFIRVHTLQGGKKNITVIATLESTTPRVSRSLKMAAMDIFTFTHGHLDSIAPHW